MNPRPTPSWAPRGLVLLAAWGAPARPQSPAGPAPFPDTPEGAYKALVYAINAGDEAAIRGVTLPTPGLGRLLEIDRSPASGLPALREGLLRATDLRRLAAGETVPTGSGESYKVKPRDVGEDRAVVIDNARLPIHCRKVDGRWRVDARLLIANRRVAGTAKPGSGPAARRVIMPLPLVGDRYPDTPEGAYRTFLLAYLTADIPNLRALAFPAEGFDRLLARPPCTFDQAAKYREGLDARPSRLLRPGDSFAPDGGAKVAGKPATVRPEDVSADKAVVAIDLPIAIPARLTRVDGRWCVDPRPLIAGLEANGAEVAPVPVPTPAPARP